MSKQTNAAPFQIRCDARQSGALTVVTDQISVTVGQVLRRDGTEQMWDFLLVLSKRKKNGTLVTRVLLCHPHWDDPLEIALIESDSENWGVRLGREEPVRRTRQNAT
jgi:hypothetical protein